MRTQFQKLFEGGEGAGGTEQAKETPAATPAPVTTPDQKDADYWKAEAKRAFGLRDEVKTQLRDMEGRVFSDEDRTLFDELKAERAKADEDKKRKEGEFDTWRQTILDKHKLETEDLTAQADQLRTRFRETIKRAEFGAASKLFGGETAKTILDTDMALDVLGKYVEVEDVEDEPGGYRVVVKTPRGDTVLGDDGRPAVFVDAMEELIKALPNHDRIFRGSGKTGSGSSGGTHEPLTQTDTKELTQRVRAGDLEAAKELRRRQAAAGGIVRGPAFQNT